MKYDSYLLTALIKLVEGTIISPAASVFTDQHSRILMLANAERAKIGIQPLKLNSALCKLAESKSQEMVERNYFSHQSPDRGSAFDMMRSNGINYTVAGENLAIVQNADHAHIAWMNSKTHKENILNPNFTEIGIGICSKGNNSYVCTQMFIG
ncbi:MAG: uncharacterized protein K0S75_1124 [Clostridia bacterium]|nr:uncharacterized protein [Clostridia bacterium]